MFGLIYKFDIYAPRKAPDYQSPSGIIMKIVLNHTCCNGINDAVLTFLLGSITRVLTAPYLSPRRHLATILIKLA